ncbi:hypothetical protein ACOMHN_001276 [Nucella lapillus]
MTEPTAGFVLTPNTAIKTFQIIQPGENEDPLHIVVYETKEAQEKGDQDRRQSCVTPSVQFSGMWNSLPPVDGDLHQGNPPPKGLKRRTSRVKAEPPTKKMKTSAAVAVTSGPLASKENHSTCEVYLPSGSNSILPLNAKENTPLQNRQSAAPSTTGKGLLSHQQAMIEPPTHPFFPSHPNMNAATPMEAVLHSHSMSLGRSASSASGVTSPKTSGSASHLIHSPVATSTPVSKSRRRLLAQTVLSPEESSLEVKRRLQQKIRHGQSGSARELSSAVSSSSPARTYSDSGLFMMSATPGGLNQPWSAALSDVGQTPVLKSPLASSTPYFRSLSASSQTGEGERQFFRTSSLGQTLGRGASSQMEGEGSKDSGMGPSLAQTQVFGEGSLEADLGATCSSWATSEDSNHPLPDLPLDENSNSQGDVRRVSLPADNEELNNSLTAMLWLSEYMPTLPNKSTGIHTSQTQGPPFPNSQSQGQLPSSRPQLRSTRVCQCGNTVGEPEKPEKNYKTLISMALLSRQDRTMTPKQIRSWFIENIPYFKFHEKCLFWQNAIRHNLSSNDCFIKNQIRNKHWTLDLQMLQDSVENREGRYRPGGGQPPMPRTRSMDSMVLRPVGQQLVLGYSGIAGASGLLLNNNMPRTGYTPILPRSSLVNPFHLLPLLLPTGDKPILSQTLSSTAILPKIPIPPLTSMSSTATTCVTQSGGGATATRGKKPRGVSGTKGAKKLRKTKSAVDPCSKDMLLQAAIQSGVTTGEGVLDDDDLSMPADVGGMTPSSQDFMTAGLLLDPSEQTEGRGRGLQWKRCMSASSVAAPCSQSSTVQQLPAVKDRREGSVPSTSRHFPYASHTRPEGLCGKASKEEDSVTPLHLPPTTHSTLMRADNLILTQTVARSPTASGHPFCLDTSTPVSKLKIPMEPPASPIRHQDYPESDPLALADLSDLLAVNPLTHISPERTGEVKKHASTPKTVPPEKDNDLMTPPSSHLRGPQTWPTAINTSLTLDLEEPLFSHLLDLPDDLSSMDHSGGDGPRTSVPQGASTQWSLKSSRDWVGSGSVQQAFSDHHRPRSKEGHNTSATMLQQQHTGPGHSTALHSDLAHRVSRPSSQLSCVAMHTDSGDSHHPQQHRTEPTSQDWRQQQNVVPQKTSEEWYWQQFMAQGSSSKDWPVQNNAVSQREWPQQQGLELHRGSGEQGQPPCVERDLLYQDKPPPTPCLQTAESNSQAAGLVLDQQSNLTHPVRSPSATTWYSPLPEFPSKGSGPQLLTSTPVQAASMPAVEKTQPSCSSIRRSLLPQLSEERNLAEQSLHSATVSSLLMNGPLPQQRQQTNFATSSSGQYRQTTLQPTRSVGGQYVDQNWSASSSVSQQNQQLQHFLRQQSPALSQAKAPQLGQQHQALQAVSPSKCVSTLTNFLLGPVCAPKVSVPQPSVQDQLSQHMVSSSPRSLQCTVRGQPWHMSSQSPWAWSPHQQPPVVSCPQQATFQPLPQQLQMPSTVTPPVDDALLPYQDSQVRSLQPPAAQLQQSPSSLITHQVQQTQQKNMSHYLTKKKRSQATYQVSQIQTSYQRGHNLSMYQAQNNVQVYQAPSSQSPYQARQNVSQSPQNKATSGIHHQTYSSMTDPVFPQQYLRPQSAPPVSSLVSCTPQGQRGVPGLRGHPSHNAFPTPTSSVLAPTAGNAYPDQFHARSTIGILPFRHTVSQPSLLTHSPRHQHPPPPLRASLSPSFPVQFPPPSSYSSSWPTVSSAGCSVKRELQFPPCLEQGAVQQMKRSVSTDLPDYPVFSVSSSSLGCVPSFPPIYSMAQDSFAGPQLFSVAVSGDSLSESTGQLRTRHRSGNAACVSDQNSGLPCRSVTPSPHGSVSGFSHTGSATVSLSEANSTGTTPFDLLGCGASSDCFPVDSAGPVTSLQAGVSGALHVSDRDVLSAFYQSSASTSAGSQGGGGGRVLRQTDNNSEADSHHRSTVPNMLNLSLGQSSLSDHPLSLPDALLAANCGSGMALGAGSSSDLAHYNPDYPAFFGAGHNSSYPIPQPHHHTTPSSAVEGTGSVFSLPAGSLVGCDPFHVDSQQDTGDWQADDFLESLIHSSPAKQPPT